jgi:aryl-alcohol dehydrogenase-like predicted oxidoreductase/predicted kinase
MRLSADRGAETVAAAAEAGITVFDTARAYGDNERLLAAALRNAGAGGTALRNAGAGGTARIFTKGGMSRPGGAWVPDGRAKVILADCEASLAALDGLAIDTYLLHSPDPRTPWATSLRALARLLDEGLVRRVGLSNVNRRQLDEAVELAPIAAVEVALSVFEERARRGGIIDRCAELGILLIAHSPLGGPRRAATLARRPPLTDIARAHGVPPAEVALAWLLALSPNVVAIPGATRPETARSAAHAAELALTAGERAALDETFATRPPRSRRPPFRAAAGAEVVLVMGIPGAGKSRIAERYRARGYVRLNRDERGGALRELADALDAELASGARRVVLDNTYLSRAARSYVIDVAGRHGIVTRCVWLNTPLAQAQVNLVERLLERFGRLPAPDELRRLARHTPGLLMPTSQMRALRELEPPSADEGFASVEVVPFERAPPAGHARPGVFIAAAALQQPGWEHARDRHHRDAPHLVFDWSPGGAPDALEPCVDRLKAEVSDAVAAALCPHPSGPPSCWCRPPLPGLPLAFARAKGVEPSRSILLGTSPAHRTLAAALGARYVPVP